MTGRADLRDRLFLAGMIALSALPYLAGLGLYSDDYAFLAAMSETRPKGIGSLFGTLIESPNLRPRPLQAAYLAFLYRAFGLAPLPAHLLNHAVFGAAILLFHAGLRRMGVPRLCAVALPLILASMPHYATIRFWLSANQIPLAMAAFFLSFLLGARYVRADARRWAWLAAGVVAIVASGMAYETFLPLCLAIPVIVWLPRFVVFDPWPGAAPGWRAAVRPFLWQLLAYSLTTAAVVGAKLALYGAHRTWTGTFEEWLWAIDWLLKGAFHVTFIDNGARLPGNALTLLQGYSRTSAVLAALAGFIAILAYLLPLARNCAPERRLPVIAGLVALGLVLFLAGYATFANNFHIGFSPTGLSNRAAAAGAIGAAIVALATVLLAGAVLPRTLAQLAVPVMIALGCATGILVSATLGVLWTEAAREQRAILERIRADVPDLAGPTALLLDGICPFVGPAPVFESAWDLKGALQVLYGNPQLKADVVKPGIAIGERALTTTLYGVLTYDYPYGPLTIYNARQRELWQIRDRAAALAYFARFDPARSTGCAFEDGGGVPVY